MKHNYLVILLLWYNMPYGYGQFQDNFNDGDFSNNPIWQGDMSNFIVNTNNELQLNAPSSGTSQLFSNVPTADSTVWEFYVRLDFAPSNSNRLKVYLNANNSDFSSALNGYFVQVGETGSDDAIELHRQSGTTTTLLIRGTDGAVASDPAMAKIRVIRDNASNWQLWADYSGGTNYVLEGTATDNAHISGQYFGVQCTYTSTRKDKFFFDDIWINPLFTDNMPPAVVQVEATSATTLQLTFDEPITSASAENINNYLVNNSISNPASAQYDAATPPTVQLTFSTPFVNNQTYQITISNIEDMVGNIQLSQTYDFTFLNIESADIEDIVINEIMVDPIPTVGLPNAEFVELLNRSDKIIDLEGLQLSNGGTPVTLPSYVLHPNNYIILCDDGDTASFSSFGDVLALNLPSLVNGGDDVILTDANGTVIHAIAYTTAWYQDASKSNGGWTLELKNPENLCIGAQNWQAAIHPSGGTPGQQNSVFNDAPDLSPPMLTQIQSLPPNRILVEFNEVLEQSSAENVANYSLNNEQPISATLDNLQQVVLTFANDFIHNTDYALTVNQVADCSGNSILTFSSDFTYYEPSIAERYDILINEIYPDFTPSLGLPETEYLELYNRTSDKVFNLENFTLTIGSKEIILPFFNLLPNHYVVLYEMSSSINFGIFDIDTLALMDFSTLGNTEESVTLTSPMGEIIHHVHYTKDWYQNSNKAEGGWALELINPNHPCDDLSNWRASEDLIGGTPGQANSVLKTAPDTTAPTLLSIFPTSNTTLRLIFSKALNSTTTSNPAHYTIDNGLSVIAADLLAPQFNTVVLTLSQPLQIQTIYSLTTQSITDCSGNLLQNSNILRFALPETIEPNDLIINEILFNPQTGGSDFVEIYNRSDKVLNLDDLVLGNAPFGLVDATEPIEQERLIFPNDYIVITESPTDILNRYAVETPKNLIQNDLPTYADNESGVVLLANGNIIDQFNYQADYHHPLLADENGVSLERIQPNEPTENINNWHSAAATVGFATPTAQNSQFIEAISSTSVPITLAKKTFSPDGDGFEDVLQIHYKMDEVGYAATLRLYDTAGRLIRNLVQNELLALEGMYKWDGITDEGQKARLGIYILVVELFHPNGTTQRIKETCVLASRL